MAEVFRLQGTIDVNVNNATSNLRQVQSELNSTGQSAQGANRTITDLAKSVLASQIFGKVKSMYNSCMTAYNGLRESEVRLTDISKLRLHANNQEIQGLKDFAGAQSKVGVIGKSAIETGMAQVASFASQKSTVTTLTQGMMDLAANTYGYNVTAKDMYNIGNMIGKGLTGNVSSMTRVGIIMSENEQKMIKNGNETQRAATLAKVLEENYGGMNKALEQTPQGQLIRLKLNFTSLKVQIAEVMAQVIGPFIEGLNKLLSAFNNLPAPIRETISKIAGFSMIILLAIAGFAKLITTVKLVVDAFGLVKDGISMLGGVFSGLGTLLCNPWTWVVLAIVAVVAALVYLYNHCESFRNAVNNGIETIKGVLSGIGSWLNSNVIQPIISAFKSIQEFMKDPFGNIQKGWDGFCKSIDDGANDIVKGIDDMVADAGDSWNSMLDDFDNGCDDMNKNIGDAFNNMGKTIGDTFNSLGDSIQGFFKDSGLEDDWNSLKDSVVNGGKEIQDGVGGAFNGIQDYFTNTAHVCETTDKKGTDLKNNALKNSKELSTGVKSDNKSLQDSIGETWNSIKQATSSKWNEISNAVKSKVGPMQKDIQSKFNSIGKSVQKGWDGAQKATVSKWNEIHKAVTSKLAPIQKDVQSKFNSIEKSIQTSWNKAQSNTTKKWSEIQKSVSNQATSIRRTVDSKFKTIGKEITNSWNSAQKGTAQKWSAMQKSVSKEANSIHKVVDSKFKSIKKSIMDNWNSAQKNTAQKWSAMQKDVNSKASSLQKTVYNKLQSCKKFILDSWNNAQKVTSQKWSQIYNTVASKVSNIISKIHGWSNLPSFVSGVFNSVKNAILGPLRSAADTVGNIINRIKSAIHGVSTSLSISAHADGGIITHATGGIATKPTSLGRDVLGNEHIFGEAGAEALLPLDGFYNYIDKKIDSVKTEIDYDLLSKTIITSIRKSSQGVYMDGNLVGIYSADSVNRENKRNEIRNKRFGGVDNV